MQNIVINQPQYHQQYQTQPIYRYHAVQKDGWRFHFSTNSLLGQGWTFDGIAFYVPVNHPNQVPLYQFHYDQGKTYGGWRFNFNTTMKPANEGWTYDKVAFCVFPNKMDDVMVPVYQYHCAQTDGWRFHFSTGQKPGHEGWTKDGIAFWAYPGQVQ